MNRGALVAQFRSDADDTATPPLFADADVHGWLLEAVDEAAIRADLLFDDSTAAVREIAVVANTASYALHAAVLRVAQATFTPTGGEPVTLELIDQVELERRVPSWRTDTGAPSFLVVKPGQQRARLSPIPTEAGTLAMEVYRLPITPMAADGDSPEIAGKHHRRLVDWALYRGYSKPNSETHDAGRAAQALTEFERYFGARPDADLRQAGEPTPFNKAFW